MLGSVYLFYLVLTLINKVAYTARRCVFLLVIQSSTDSALNRSSC